MKKSTITKKLNLRPEILKALKTDTLKQINGGITSPCPIGTAWTDCETKQFC